MLLRWAISSTGTRKDVQQRLRNCPCCIENTTIVTLVLYLHKPPTVVELEREVRFSDVPIRRVYPIAVLVVRKPDNPRGLSVKQQIRLRTVHVVAIARTILPDAVACAPKKEGGDANNQEKQKKWLRIDF